MTITIYILECEGGKYYVGRSAHPRERILSHFNKRGSEWTKLYKPKHIIRTFNGDAFDEEKHTLKTMETFGIDNVRGGSYCAIILSATDKAKAKQIIQSLTDKCYKCGSSGHFAADCKKKQKDSESDSDSDSDSDSESDSDSDSDSESDSDSDSDSESDSDDVKTGICYLCKKPEYDGDDCIWCLKNYEACRCDGTQPDSKYCNCCMACQETRRSYWTDGIYGSCLECCCIDCGERKCKCD